MAAEVAVIRYRDAKWQVRVTGVNGEPVFPQSKGFFVEAIATQFAEKCAAFMGVQEISQIDERLETEEFDG